MINLTHIFYYFPSFPKFNCCCWCQSVGFGLGLSYRMTNVIQHWGSWIKWINCPKYIHSQINGWSQGKTYLLVITLNASLMPWLCTWSVLTNQNINHIHHNTMKPINISVLHSILDASIQRSCNAFFHITTDCSQSPSSITQSLLWFLYLLRKQELLFNSWPPRGMGLFFSLPLATTR